MKIEAIDVFGYVLTYAHGEYVMSNGRAAVSQPSTLVRLRTNTGLEGWGEASTLGGTYLPAFAGGTRTAIREIAPTLIGLDPANISLVNRAMDGVLLGQQSAKSAIDIACWDILGKSCNMPVSALLGGVLQESFPLYEAVPLASPEEMADFVQKRSAAGIRRFQVKVGNDPYDDIARTRSVAAHAGGDAVVIADANGGWNLQAALIAVRNLADLNIYIEQPCRDTADCAIVQRSSTLPLVLDESVVNTAELFRAKYEAGAGSVNVKLGRLGGITGAARIRAAAQDLGMTMCIEDVWGGDVATAAISHMAASTAPEALLHASFFNDWTNEHVAGYLPRSSAGRGSAPTGPGLGIEVDARSLDAPLFSIH
ncbi:L-alanine-DL-glutamate epimerase-like enolase superfamily enzyme [Pseudochelatococcus lubricantis]|uniref:L-alanine-DL-glutamate epimerase-like enolase superfamily enzyme n=1 Tax=Pseudochelatococcus lubricantis TaxID=1538102 RepID=A0ABX0V3S2_9HYPH|nr:mandelate racemase/muconate lactonizing enzyme family protein [Pseudochelatococcus lubricantis]NIJ59798.1 L-alanine-DL-glutamate epimerase-like enolase superfamily enzyme [Pseudochelatococcus lubricantis]